MPHSALCTYPDKHFNATSSRESYGKIPLLLFLFSHQKSSVQRHSRKLKLAYSCSIAPKRMFTQQKLLSSISEHTSRIRNFFSVFLLNYQLYFNTFHIFIVYFVFMDLLTVPVVIPFQPPSTYRFTPHLFSKCPQYVNSIPFSSNSISAIYTHILQKTYRLNGEF